MSITSLFIHLIRKSLKQFDVGITRYSRLEKLNTMIPVAVSAELLGKSKSQLRQDLFVLAHVAFKRDGYFVEVGASNGIDLSNTYLMEKEFGWRGILAEPAACWQNDLKKNRGSDIESSCVWKESGLTLAFNEVEFAELSTINSFSESDSHGDFRKKGKTYDVSTISLRDLLLKYNAPKQIDYLSIDTEGSEYDILSAFDFSEYSFEVITCEHNYTPAREKLCALLTENGYQRVFEELSDFDDWYVRRPR